MSRSKACWQQVLIYCRLPLSTVFQVDVKPRPSNERPYVNVTIRGNFSMPFSCRSYKMQKPDANLLMSHVPGWYCCSVNGSITNTRTLPEWKEIKFNVNAFFFLLYRPCICGLCAEKSVSWCHCGNREKNGNDDHFVACFLLPYTRQKTTLESTVKSIKTIWGWGVDDRTVVIFILFIKTVWDVEWKWEGDKMVSGQVVFQIIFGFKCVID